MDRLQTILDDLGLVAIRTDPLVVALAHAPERTTVVPRWEPLEIHLRAARKRLLLAKDPTSVPAQPCCAPAPDERSLGIWDFAEAVLSGDVDFAVQDERLTCCAACDERRIDAEGGLTLERLYRLVDGAPYCGAPWSGPRNAYREGCGCPLRRKVKYRVSKCPRGRWQLEGGTTASASNAASPSGSS